MQPRAKRWVRFAAKVATVAVVVLVVAGMIYEKIGERQDRRRYPQIGRSVDIGGRTLNIYCSGQGDPSVVFEPPAHTAGYTWINVQSEVARFTRACWYDRAGYGWSDPGPAPRTSLAIARDLHALLHADGVPPPYVLVSGGGTGDYHVRVYNGLFPNEVAGAIIGPADPDIDAHELTYMKGPLSPLSPWVKGIGCAVLRPVMVHVGLFRLLGNIGPGRPIVFGTLDQDQRRELDFLTSNPSNARTEGEGCSHEESNEEVRAAGNFGSRPLVVLANAEPSQAPSPAYEKEIEAFNEYWFHQLLPRLTSLSTRGHLVLTENTAAPETVVAAVRDVVTEVRANQQK